MTRKKVFKYASLCFLKPVGGESCRRRTSRPSPGQVAQLLGHRPEHRKAAGAIPGGAREVTHQCFPHIDSVRSLPLSEDHFLKKRISSFRVIFIDQHCTCAKTVFYFIF